MLGFKRTIILCAGMLFSFFPQARANAEPTLAEYKTEAEAISAGARLGIGEATIAGPTSIRVMSYGSWVLTYTAGRAGIQPGGGIRIGMRHVHPWTDPQFDPGRTSYYYVRVVQDNGEEAISSPIG